MGQTVASGSGQGGGTAASGNHVVRGIVFAALGGICWGFSGTCAPVSYTHLDVYKRQRMFLGQMSKPDLDSIDGLSPAVSIDQKTTSKRCV